jgi:drug/metabolite transporter (DMT)-like permease
VLAIALALAASLCYGTSNFIGPLLSRTLAPTAVLVVGQAVAMVASGAVVIGVAAPPPGGGALAAAVAAGLGNALGLAAFYRAAAIGPISVVAPIGATGAAVPVILGLAVGEEVAALALAGILLAVSGAAMAARRDGDASAPAGERRRSIVYAVLSAIGFGVFLAGMAPASQTGVFWAVMISRISLLASVIGGALLLGSALRVPARQLPKVAVPGLLLFLGTMSYSFATQTGLLSVVSVLGSLFPVVTVALALALLGERLNRVQRVGVGATVLGVVLISV